MLETGVLKKKNLILAATKDAILTGANFIKTSTGKTESCLLFKPSGRNNIAVYSNIKKKVGLKISVGLRNKFQS